MRVSRKADYAVRAMVYLASHRRRAAVPSQEISDAMAVPYRFLGQVLYLLKLGGLTASDKGVKGGWMLTRSPSAISLLEIVEAVQGSIVMLPCLVEKPTCQFAETCLPHRVWSSIQAGMREHLARTKLAALTGKPR
jgi:Rrf2 family protein